MKKLLSLFFVSCLFFAIQTYGADYCLTPGAMSSYVDMIKKCGQLDNKNTAMSCTLDVCGRIKAHGANKCGEAGYSRVPTNLVHACRL